MSTEPTQETTAEPPTPADADHQAAAPPAADQEPSPEAVDAAEPAAPPAAPIDAQALQTELSEARRKAEEHWDLLLRAKAEVDNVQRRARRDVEQAHRFALEKFTGDLLDVKDNLERGLSAAQDGESVDPAKLIEGTGMTLKALTKAFEQHGVATVDPVGEKFNPELHQAMAQQSSADHEPGTVLAVVAKGYTLNGRLLRPAMVMVSKAP